MTVSSGSATAWPGNGGSLPETQNICLRLTHGLHNSSVEILAIDLADGGLGLMLHRHGDHGSQFTGNLVPDDTHRSDLAEGTERIAQGVFACPLRQVCYTDVYCNFLL